MKLAILQNSDVMEKNQYRIRIQRPKISKDLLVSFNAQKKVKFCCPVLFANSGIIFDQKLKFSVPYTLLEVC